jgi:hypothetical protein
VARPRSEADARSGRRWGNERAGERQRAVWTEQRAARQGRAEVRAAAERERAARRCARTRSEQEQLAMMCGEVACARVARVSLAQERSRRLQASRRRWLAGVGRTRVEAQRSGSSASVRGSSASVREWHGQERRLVMRAHGSSSTRVAEQSGQWCVDAGE